VLDPQQDLRRYEAEARLTGDVASRQHYADALLRHGRAPEAVAVYRQALVGLFQSDPDLLLGLARAQFESGSQWHVSKEQRLHVRTRQRDWMQRHRRLRCRRRRYLVAKAEGGTDHVAVASTPAAGVKEQVVELPLLEGHGLAAAWGVGLANCDEAFRNKSRQQGPKNTPRNGFIQFR
jgi:hypothetical protein